MRLPGGTKTQVPRPGPCLLPCCPARGSRVILKQSRSVPAGPPWLQERSAPYHTWPEVTFKLAQVSDVGTAALLHPQRCAGPLWCPCWFRGHFFTPAHTCQGALEGGAPGGLRAPAHTQPGRPASPRATRGVVGTALPGVLQGALGNPRQAWLQGALSPPTHTGLCASSLELRLRPGSAGRALLCPLGARGRSSAADGSTALQEGQMAPGSFLSWGQITM